MKILDDIITILRCISVVVIISCSSELFKESVPIWAICVVVSGLVLWDLTRSNT